MRDFNLDGYNLDDCEKIYIKNNIKDSLLDEKEKEKLLKQLYIKAEKTSIKKILSRHYKLKKEDIDPFFKEYIKERASNPYRPKIEIIRETVKKTNININVDSENIEFSKQIYDLGITNENSQKMFKRIFYSIGLKCPTLNKEKLLELTLAVYNKDDSSGYLYKGDHLYIYCREAKIDYVVLKEKVDYLSEIYVNVDLDTLIGIAIEIYYVNEICDFIKENIVHNEVLKLEFIDLKTIINEVLENKKNFPKLKLEKQIKQEITKHSVIVNLYLLRKRKEIYDINYYEGENKNGYSNKKTN